MPVRDNARSAISSEAVHRSWANTPDRAARTAPGQQAAFQRFLDEAGGDPARAEHLRRAHLKRISRLAVEARRKKHGGPAVGEEYIDAVADVLSCAPKLSARQLDRLAGVLRGGAA